MEASGDISRFGQTFLGQNPESTDICKRQEKVNRQQRRLSSGQGWNGSQKMNLESSGPSFERMSAASGDGPSASSTEQGASWETYTAGASM